MNFNGSGGVWRRQAIEDAGGWQGVPDGRSRPQFPRQLRAGGNFATAVCRQNFLCRCPLKSQQHRWAKGSIQTAKKLASRLLRAPLPWFTKYQACLHLVGYLMHPFILLAALTSPLPFWFEGNVFSRGPLIGSGLFTLATFGPLSMCLYTQAHLYPNWKQRLYGLPLLLMLGTGLALNNTRAILEALLGWHSPFVRTPKFHIETAADTWRDKRYRLAFPWTSLEACWPVTVPTPAAGLAAGACWSTHLSSIPLVCFRRLAQSLGDHAGEELPAACDDGRYLVSSYACLYSDSAQTSTARAGDRGQTPSPSPRPRGPAPQRPLGRPQRGAHVAHGPALAGASALTVGCARGNRCQRRARTLDVYASA
jgi:hypothetical protein